MLSPKIGFLCASLRAGSINKKLETALVKRFKAKGASTHIIDLSSFDLPLYHGDLATPDGVKKLIKSIKSYDGIVIVSPEYNGGLPPVLKNAIDWTSTVETGHIKDAVYGIASCTPGPLSGVMVMRQIQYILTRLGANVIPVQVGCGNASEAFDDDGNLTAEPTSTLADTMRDAMLANIKRA